MFGFSGKQQGILHLTWVAFFLTFVAWFNMAPFNTTLMAGRGFTRQQIDILMICNVALTIPARVAIGSLVDRHGPRVVFSFLLAFSALACFLFSLSNDFGEFVFSRLMMSVTGAGFVVGIKMIAEWFPPEKMGTAQGLYAGWGNFGAAAAAFSLPPVALLFPQDTGWRVATALSGVLCLVWAAVYFKFARDLTEKSRDFEIGLSVSMQVSSRSDLVLQIVALFPLYGALLAFVWKLSGHPLPLLTTAWALLLMAALLAVYAYNACQCVQLDLPESPESLPEEKKYEFRQIAILSLVYSLTFGSELAVVSMFPQFLESTFGLSVAAAGALGSSFAFLNLVTRPSGGWLSDRFGRRRTLIVLVLGSCVSYGFMGGIGPEWPVWGAIGLAMICSVFLQAGNGACFSMVPLIRKDLTGKMAGLAGAYGNVGAVCFLTALSFVGDRTFFKILGLYALFVLITLFFLKSFKILHSSYRQN